jgi:hypothetical protein
MATCRSGSDGRIVAELLARIAFDRPSLEVARYFSQQQRLSPAEKASNTGGLFVFLRLSDDCRFAVFPRFLVVVLLVIIVVGVSWRHRVNEHCDRLGASDRGALTTYRGSLEQPPPFPLQITLSFQGGIEANSASAISH